MRRPTVHLVGAGPGDPGMLTVRAAALLSAADVVFHDELVSEAILATIPRAAEVVSVGHRAGWEKHPIAAVAKWMALRARAGQTVVRLKGGDPYVFGRGGEEALALLEEGVDFEIVPGISSAIAGPAAAGIPVTHRGLATSVTFVTAHEVGTAAETVRWDHMAEAGATLVVMMGAARVGAVTAALLAAGRSAGTPAALVIRATRPDQDVITASLGSMVAAIPAGGTQTPAILVVGEVVELGASLGGLIESSASAQWASRRSSGASTQDVRAPVGEDPRRPLTSSTVAG